MNDRTGDGDSCDSKNLGGKEMVKLYLTTTNFRNNWYIRAILANAKIQEYRVTSILQVSVKTHVRSFLICDLALFSILASLVS
jgi:hypothetical protein